MRPARRYDSVDGGMENAFAAARTDRYVPDLYAIIASCILDSTNALWNCVGVFIVDDAGVRSDGTRNSCCASTRAALPHGLRYPEVHLTVSTKKITQVGRSIPTRSGPYSSTAFREVGTLTERCFEFEVSVEVSEGSGEMHCTQGVALCQCGKLSNGHANSTWL